MAPDIFHLIYAFGSYSGSSVGALFCDHVLISGLSESSKTSLQECQGVRFDLVWVAESRRRHSHMRSLYGTLGIVVLVPV